MESLVAEKLGLKLLGEFGEDEFDFLILLRLLRLDLFNLIVDVDRELGAFLRRVLRYLFDFLDHSPELIVSIFLEFVDIRHDVRCNGRREVLKFAFNR